MFENEEIRIGVYICHCGTNISATVDVEKVQDYASNLPNVVVARDYPYMCSDPGQNLIKKDIRSEKLNRVVVASCSPRIHEVTFRRTCEEAGLNPWLLEMANIREQCSWVHEDGTDKAKDLIASAVARSSLAEPLIAEKVGVIPNALVIGGGIAGIYAALDLADKGFHVYLVEKSPTIGGHMLQLDKTFPTLDCSACILTPKMVEVDMHEDIDLITYAEVKEIGGYVGDFHVRIEKKPRYVDEEKCKGCIEDCSSVCKISCKSEFDLISERKAIYIPSAQAIPMVARIDDEHCIGCRLCEYACKEDAIDYFQIPEQIELKVGVIIVATGYDLFPCETKPEYGYGYENVLTSLEFERLVCASGPTEGEIVINGEKPKDVVFISCVGSRCKEHEYCSRVCCMYTAKHAHQVREKIPDANITVFYTDIRAFGDGFEEFYERVRSESINYKRRELDDPISVREADDKLLVESGDDELKADLVVLATGLIPRGDMDELSRTLKVLRSSDGFFLEAHPKLQPVDTAIDGIFLAGCCQSPKDIPDSIAQACGAAAMASYVLSKKEIETEPVVAVVDENICVGCRTCEGVCEFGALHFDETTMKVNEILCKGCGSCAATCPNGAIEMKHFQDDQIFAQIDVMLSP